MAKKFKAFAASVAVVVLIFVPAIAAGQVNDLVIPAPVGYVNDFAGWLSPETEGTLEQQLILFEQETSHEVIVVTTPSLQETYIEDLAVRWFEEWGVGKAHNDNGILFLIVPEERQMRIEVGYGLEGILPDTLAAQVLDKIVKPEFQMDNPDAGVIKGVDAIVKITKGEEVDFGSATNEMPWLPFIILLIVVIIVVGLHILSRKMGWSRGSSRGGFWGSGRGGSRGGFGGFGGGSSGGGGASSGW